MGKISEAEWKSDARIWSSAGGVFGHCLRVTALDEVAHPSEDDCTGRSSDPEFGRNYGSKDSSLDGVGQVSRSTLLEDLTVNSSPAHATGNEEPNQAHESTPHNRNEGVEDGDSEVQKLREELRRTQGLVSEQQSELRRMQELVTKLRVSGANK